MTFPVDIHNQQVNALYDTGAGCSLINYSMYEKLGITLDKGYQPIVKSSTGENMGALGQITFTFKINDTPFTQSFIVCRHMTRHMILGTDFTVTNFVGVIWTSEGTQKLMDSNGKTIIELNIRCPLGTRLFSEDTSRRPPHSTTRMHQTCHRQDQYQNGYWVSPQEP